MRLPLALAAIAIAIAPGRARAHLGHVITRAERYLKLDASEDDTRLVVSLMLGPDEGQRVLEAADADRDGSVTRAEADAYLAQWGEGLREEVPVEIDGERVALAWSDGWLEPIGRVRRVDATVEMVAHLPSSAREHDIAYEDRMVRRETFDRTDVAFQAHDGAELLACGAIEGENAPAECLERELVVMPGAPQATRFAARVRYPGRSEIGWRGIGAAIAAALAVIAAAAIARRRRR